MKSRSCILLAVACLLAWDARAGDFDGTRPFVCAALEANECMFGSECLQAGPEDLEVPQFVRVDFAARSMSAGGRSTAIQSAIHAGGRLVLQGVEARRGWSMTIDEETGLLVAAIAGQEEGFVVFGACTINH